MGLQPGCTGVAASGCVRLQAREAERTVEPRLVGALRAGHDAQAGGDSEDELQCELCVAAAQPVEGELVLRRIEQQRGVAQQVMPDGVGWRVGCMEVGRHSPRARVARQVVPWQGRQEVIQGRADAVLRRHLSGERCRLCPQRGRHELAEARA